MRSRTERSTLHSIRTVALAIIVSVFFVPIHSAMGDNTGTQDHACFPNSTCNAGLTCTAAGICDAVGTAPGQPCSPHGACLYPLYCTAAKICEPQAGTGTQDHPCLPDGSCNPGLTCTNARICEPSSNVGTQGHACFPNGSCNPGLTCTSAQICEPPSGIGTQDHACLANFTCNPGLMCIASVCDAAGVTAGQPCSPRGACLYPLWCTDEKVCQPQAPVLGAFEKPGNNGTVSCNTFCAGSQWGGIGAIGICVGGQIIQGPGAGGNITSCDQVVGYPANVVCYCRPYSPPPSPAPAGSFEKPGNNGTVSCNTFCANNGGNWGQPGTCVGGLIDAGASAGSNITSCDQVVGYPASVVCYCNPCQASGLAACNNKCVNLQTDSGNCKSCGNACPSNQSCCGGQCVSLQSNANCGECGKACGSTQTCNQNACGCPAGLTNCNGNCVKCPTSGACSGTSCGCPSGRTNCGGSCVTCPAGGSCSGSSCVCSNGRTNCGGACVDTANDPKNCRSCGSACGSNQSCINSICTGNNVVRCPDGHTCAPGQSCCGQYCIDSGAGLCCPSTPSTQGPFICCEWVAGNHLYSGMTCESNACYFLQVGATSGTHQNCTIH